jgi:hypothetical protein
MCKIILLYPHKLFIIIIIISLARSILKAKELVLLFNTKTESNEAESRSEFGAQREIGVRGGGGRGGEGSDLIPALQPQCGQAGRATWASVRSSSRSTASGTIFG